MTSRHLLRLLCTVLLAGAALAGLHAGTISGRVTDGYTKLALGGARVTAGGVETYSETTGEFTLTGVPAGRQLVEVNYVGYAPLQLSLEVDAAGVTRLDPVFNRDVVKLAQFVITGANVGTARSLNEQRAAETLTNVVAADDIGRFPDQNAAESAQRIPGVALYRDQGEGRFLVVRGIRPDLNGMQLNGVAMTSPDRGARTVPLDVIPSDALGALEVTKVPRPDLDIDGLGGRVNLKTRSPFDADGRQLQLAAQGQWNNLRERLSSKFNGTYSDILNDGKLGFIFSPTWQERRFGSDNIETSGSWAAPAGNTVLALPDINYREYEITRTRYGANAGLEFRPDPSTLFYVRGLYSYFTDRENRYVTTIPFSEASSAVVTSETSATFTSVRRENKQLRNREKQQDLTSYSAGFEKTVADWRLDGRVAFSRGNENRREDTVIFRKSARGTNWTYAFPGLYSPVVTQTAGTDISDPASFNELNRLRSAPAWGSDREQNYAFNARRDFATAAGNRAFAKFGAQLRQKTKAQNREQSNFTAPATFTFASLAEMQGDYAFFRGPRVNAEAFTKQFVENKAAFTETRDVVSSEQEDWSSDEDVLAGYAMGGVTFGDLNVSGGARYERTEFSASGNEQRIVGGVTTFTRANRDRSYNNFLPGVYLRYDLDKQTVLRASWTNSVARPAFSESALIRSVNDDAKTVTESNPGLKALESVNWDASAEHYFHGLGVVSLAGFYKKITNFTYRTSVPNGDAANPTYLLTTYVNGPEGDISGLEAAFTRRLDFLPGELGNVTFMTNYTLTHSSATYLRTATNTFEKAPFIGQSPRNANAALSYEAHGLFVRLSFNYRSSHLREDEAIGDVAANDIYIDNFKQWDLNASYRLSRGWELFGEILNLTNEPFRVAFTPARTRFRQFEEYGWTANFGVRWKL
ncbi:MAG: TonB-dependent receptor [Candidatus Didemnitutus sp.]|nr:TonB-dependent receptor [Candidatus Didemnitutus sp.]